MLRGYEVSSQVFLQNEFGARRIAGDSRAAGEKSIGLFRLLLGSARKSNRR